MRSLSRPAVVVSALLAAVALVALPALAAETSNSEFVIVRPDDVFPDDLYTGAIRVVIEGTLDGDLIAFAGEDVVIDGVVTGSVYAVAPSVRVTGQVQGSMRVAAKDLEVKGNVDGDLVGAVFTADLGPSSVVSGDVLLWSRSVDASGIVGGDLTGTQRRLDLAGEVRGDVEVSVGRLTVAGPLVVGGDLGYRSKRDGEGLDAADVDGAIVHELPLPPNLRIRALVLLGRFLVVLFLGLTALVTAYGWPERTSSAVAAVGRAAPRRWLAGLLICLAPVLVAGVAGVILGLAPAAAAFPLLVVFIPVTLGLIGISLALALVAGAPVVGWLGGVLFGRLDLYGSILVGSVIAGFVWYLPVVGWLVPLVVIPLGVGAWVAAFRQSAAGSASVDSSISSSAHSGG